MTNTVADFQQVWSDYHKEAYGFRPRSGVPDWTVEQWEEEFTRLGRICESNRVSEQEAEAQAIEETEALLTKLIGMGAQDRTTALRWLHEAHGTSGDNEYLCYSLGLPYGYFSK
jgi:hypothetical protein